MMVVRKNKLFKKTIKSLSAIRFFIFSLLFVGAYQTSFSQFSDTTIINDDAINVEMVVARDFDNDGDKDIAWVSPGIDYVVWQENEDGLGNFGFPIPIDTNFSEVNFLTTGDIDNDGDIDIVASSPASGIVGWYENNDDFGGFSEFQLISDSISFTKDLDLGDIDNDGDLDVLVSTVFNGEIYWIENTDGEGSFDNPLLIDNVSGNARMAIMIDINNDGALDVAVGSPSDDAVFWYQNMDGLGSFGERQLVYQNTDPNLGGYTHLDHADINQDGFEDILVADFGGDTITWHENMGGTGVFADKQVVGVTHRPFMFYISDLNNDNLLDVVSASYAFEGDPGRVVWWQGDGTGNFIEQDDITNDVVGPRSVFAADLDNDGDNDVLSSDIVAYNIAWYENLTILNTAQNDILPFTITPNPTRGQIHIATEIELDKLVIYNKLGQLVFSSYPFEDITVDFLPRGTYTLQLFTKENKVYYHKIIKY